MRKIRYGVAMSLDGYIAGPNGEADWIVPDPDFDFGKLWTQFDTLLMGRRTYDAARSRLGPSSMKGMRVVVISRTLRPDENPDVTILCQPTRESIEVLRSQPGPSAKSKKVKNANKDIWLFGGSETVGALLAMGEVDTVEVSVIPVLLGGGIPLIPPISHIVKLRLADHAIYPTGRLHLIYEVAK